VKLIDICSGECVCPPGYAQIEIIRITDDSRDARPGVLFFGTPKSTYLAAAKSAGAITVGEPGSGADIEVENVSACMGRLSSRFFGDPSLTVHVAGITGTNGKTSTAWMVYHLWRASGIKAGLIGTLGVRYDSPEGEVSLNTGYTTPRSYQIQELLRKMKTAGVTHCVMEVSSEALALGRLTGTRFAVASFTNLSRDHLDFHGTMEEYFSAKKLLLAQAAQAGGRLVVYESQDRSEEGKFSRRMSDYASSLGARVKVLTEPVAFGFAASFQNINATIAIHTAFDSGPECEDALRNVSKIPPVPGRFEPVDIGAAAPGSIAIVDYAHSPDALATLLTEAHATGRYVIVVFGCGGNRDPGKRPIMGEIAGRLADFAIITEDNPRKEEPALIRSQIRAGVRVLDRSYVIEVPGRREAIEHAIVLAKEKGNSMVVVAGKGHEQVQILEDRTEEFSDREEILRAVSRITQGKHHA